MYGRLGAGLGITARTCLNIYYICVTRIDGIVYCTIPSTLDRATIRVYSCFRQGKCLIYVNKERADKEKNGEISFYVVGAKCTSLILIAPTLNAQSCDG